MKTIIMMMMLCVLVWNGQAQAGCLATITATTPSVDFVDNGDGTVLHKKTALTWKRCSEGQTWIGGTCTGAALTTTWSGALQQAVTNNNGGGFATHTDWRVPNIKELTSIVERQCFTPAINAVIFPLTPSSAFWSSTPYWRGNTIIGVEFNFGDDFTPASRIVLQNVRLVRGGPEF